MFNSRILSLTHTSARPQRHCFKLTSQSPNEKANDRKEVSSERVGFQKTNGNGRNKIFVTGDDETPTESIIKAVVKASKNREP